MDDSPKHYIKQMKSELKGYITCHSMYMTFQKNKTTGTEMRSAVARYRRYGKGIYYKGTLGKIHWVIERSLVCW